VDVLVSDLECVEDEPKGLDGEVGLAVYDRRNRSRLKVGECTISVAR